MAYLDFDKSKLVNLSYSLERELLRANRKGAYASTTIIRSNTRKYHGLLVTPQPAIDNELHVLLSALDPTIIQHDTSFNLGVHRYPGGIFSPKGHKYVRELQMQPIPAVIYRVGGVVFKVEMVFSSLSDRILLKYTLVDSHSETRIQLKPYLAFRSRHSLSKANEFANTKYEEANKGVSFKLYQGYTPVFIQANKTMEYIHSPNWYNNIEYFEEQQRGYDFQEDLLVPGYFEFSLNKGESIYVAAGTQEGNPSTFSRLFNNEIKKRIPRTDFKNALLNSAEQFLVNREGKAEVIAGYHWYRRLGRDTFIALPGLTLAQGKVKECKAILDTMIKEMSGPLFPNVGCRNTVVYNSIDAPLWFFWTLQHYAKATSNEEVWKHYGKTMKHILRAYRAGTLFNIKMDKHGLVSGGELGNAITWMNAISEGKAVTARIGYPVEVNALAYNAIMFSLELANEFNDSDFVKEFEPIAHKFPKAFFKMFWNDQYGYLADYVNGDVKDWSIRPNMLLAASLPYSPIKKKYKKAILEVISRELLTNRGLRTLSPNHNDYECRYFGNEIERDKQFHQGTVWPWLMGAFTDAYLKVYGKSGVKKIEWYLEQFDDVMTEHGIGSISEIYDGNPPHLARGAISYASSVGEVLRALTEVESYLK